MSPKKPHPAEPAFPVMNSDIKQSTRFSELDDFNSYDLKNVRQGVWETFPKDDPSVSMKVVKGDAFESNRGFALKVNLSLSSDKTVRIESPLNNLDISQAEFFVLQCRHSSAGGVRPQITLTLEDAFGKSESNIITEKCPVSQERFGNITLPVGAFHSLDFNRLSRISVEVKATQSPFEGEIWIDEIGFYGPEELDFKSRRDNLVSFPEQEVNEKQMKRLKAMEGKKDYERYFLRTIAADTWKYFQNAKDKNTHLIVDHIRIGEGPLVADYTSITNIAMDLMANVAAYELAFITREKAVGHIKNVFETLNQLERWNGFFYNYYSTTHLGVTREYISSVDSGWLAIAMVIVRQAFKEELYEDASAYLDSFDFGEFLDPMNNQLSIGFDIKTGELAHHHYGLLASEARATSLYAIGKGDINKDHWWFIYRTLPEAWEWQNQTPSGSFKSRDGVEYFQGHYEYENKKFVPSWGGSMFEFLMPTLILDEKRLAPEGLGLNNRVASEIQRDYALSAKKYPVWGISPSTTANGRSSRYGEYGVKALSAKGYPDQEVITPHAGFLALETIPQDAIKNAFKLLNFKIYGAYAYYDSVSLRHKKVNQQYLALDQGMILLAICNYLQDGMLQRYYEKDEVFLPVKELLKESFFNE